ncbi:MAG TPA: hypothetical protein VGK50_09045 [Coriobacteriia bacterium]|jgi:hypothetical protein
MAYSARISEPGREPRRIPTDLEVRLRQDYEREDERWSSSSQLRDWVILLVIGALDFLWMLIIFLTERGIR